MLTQEAQKLLQTIRTLQADSATPQDIVRTGAELRLNFYDFLFAVGDAMGESAITDIMPQMSLSSFGALEESLHMLETTAAYFRPKAAPSDEDTIDNARLLARDALNRISGHVNTMMLSLPEDMQYEILMEQIRQTHQKVDEFGCVELATRAVKYNTLTMSDAITGADESVLLFHLARIHAQRLSTLTTGDELCDIFARSSDSDGARDGKTSPATNPEKILQEISAHKDDKILMRAGVDKLIEFLHLNIRTAQCMPLVRDLQDEYNLWQGGRPVCASTAQNPKK